MSSMSHCTGPKSISMAIHEHQQRVRYHGKGSCRIHIFNVLQHMQAEKQQKGKRMV